MEEGGSSGGDVFCLLSAAVVKTWWNSISPFTVGHSFKLLTSGEFLCVYNQEEIFPVVFKL